MANIENYDEYILKISKINSSGKEEIEHITTNLTAEVYFYENIYKNEMEFISKQMANINIKSSLIVTIYSYLHKNDIITNYLIHT